MVVANAAPVSLQGDDEEDDDYDDDDEEEDDNDNDDNDNVFAERRDREGEESRDLQM